MLGRRKLMNLVEKHALLPDQIDSDSIGMVTANLLEQGWEDNDNLFVASRIVRAEGDFAIAPQIRFSSQAVRSGLQALLNKKTVVTDVRMVQVGISESLLKLVGVETICKINTTEVAERAILEKTTRSISNIRELKTYLDDSIICVGNAPTALLEVVDLVRSKAIHPALVIGVPVGFVACSESKDELLKTDVEFITIEGNRGGSSAAAATMNALMLLALKKD
ncbi:MAG TPA: hypothetical protein DEZ08_02430 [Dehalococcoidia bacterium]|jgi:precorrin-8X/cobalt-precorrin-8 methylmutase|nr:hypothetical protein [Dehalococcoidia bacterium]|tara:strand:+ start:293 stop:958 length:666 start_codon:yes stop_codon:yes gene_type:complete